MQYFDEAAADFRAVLKLDPDNRVARHQLNVALRKQADGAVQERSMFAGMFHKFAQQDLLVCLTFACASCFGLLQAFACGFSSVFEPFAQFF